MAISGTILSHEEDKSLKHFWNVIQNHTTTKHTAITLQIRSCIRASASGQVLLRFTFTHIFFCPNKLCAVIAQIVLEASQVMLEFLGNVTVNSSMFFAWYVSTKHMLVPLLSLTLTGNSSLLLLMSPITNKKMVCVRFKGLSKNIRCWLYIYHISSLKI